MTTTFKAGLIQTNVSNEMDVMMDDKKRTEMRERAKRTTVPQIFINGQHIGGSDELAALEKAGKLDALLAEPG